MIKKEMIAMLLAGGQGSRLGVLTAKVAKPAVSFGGKYRIIDFPLSNCINSGVDTVGVLTQYQPLASEYPYRDRHPVGSGPECGRRDGSSALREKQRQRLVHGHRQRHLSEPGVHGDLQSGLRAHPVRRSHLQDGLRGDARLPQGQQRRYHHCCDAGAHRGGQPLRRGDHRRQQPDHRI